MSPKSLLNLLVMSLVCSGCAVSDRQVSTDAVEPAQVTLENSQITTHYSPITDHTYGLKIFLPGAYDQQSVEREYPLIIKLDGQWDFHLAVGAYNCITFDGQMPQSVIVGIDWGEIEGDIHEVRSRDLLPLPVPQYPGSGQAEKFLRVLVEEIIPQLEDRFRLNGERVLLGGSTSAVFATYALLERPDAFTGAIAIAGGYDVAGETFEKQISGLDATSALAGKRLYMGVGSLDAVAPQVVALAQSLDQAELQGFDIHLDHRDGFGHSGMNIPGYAAGYQHIFRRPVLKLSPKEMEAYPGTYTSADGGADLSVHADKTSQRVRFADDSPLQLQAKSPTEFYHPGMWLNLRFGADYVIVDSPSGEERFSRAEGG